MITNKNKNKIEWEGKIGLQEFEIEGVLECGFLYGLGHRMKRNCRALTIRTCYQRFGVKE